jgi:ATP-dependent Clp protease, protease subunit
MVGSDFKEYAIKHLGVTNYEFDNWSQLQNTLYSNSLTPYVLEERELRATAMDIFSRLMMERIIWLAGPVNDRMSTIVQAQLMFLDNIDDSKPITLHIDSPGGSVKSGLSMVDSINLLKCDVKTINTGMAASMGSILLGSGTKGMRGTLKHSKVMLHQVSAGTQGTLADMEISLMQAKKYNDVLFGLLGEYTNKDPEQVKKDADRDLWLNAEEALEYGIVDYIVGK